DDVAPTVFDLEDAEAQALSDVARPRLAAAIDLRPGTKRAHGADLHLEAALVLSADQSLHGDAVHHRLLQLAGNVPTASDCAFEDDRARAAAVVDDGRLYPIADRKVHLSALRIAEFRQVDHRLALAADLDESGGRTQGDHAPAHHLTGGHALLAG